MSIHLHREEDSGNNKWLSDVVIGFSDGLIIPFALAAGLSAAVDSTNIILIAGIAQIVAGSIAMGMGGYYSGKTGQHHHHDKGEKWLDGGKKAHDADMPGTKEFFANLGLSEEMQRQAMAEVAKDKSKWQEFIMKYGQYGYADQPVTKTAGRSGFNIGLAYAAGGIVPLLPYCFVDVPLEALKFSAVATLVCLFVFGWIKSKITGGPLLWGALRITLIGATAAGAAFGVARIFEAA
jgi:vacuolar iron transporter family protein